MLLDIYMSEICGHERVLVVDDSYSLLIVALYYGWLFWESFHLMEKAAESDEILGPCG